LIQQLTPPLRSERPKPQYEKHLQRLNSQNFSKSLETALDVTPGLDFEIVEENSTLLQPAVLITCTV
jgi:hypothetical protein